MKTVSLSEAEKNLSFLVDTLTTEPSEPMTITVGGKAAAVLITPEDYTKLKKLKKLKDAEFEREMNEIFDTFKDLNESLAKR